MRQSVRMVFWIILAACSFASTTQAAGLIDRNAAARFGMARAWFTQVGSARATGAISHITYDQGILLVQTTRGLLTALDGETGRILWSTQTGPADRMCTAAAANAEHVVVVNGSELIVIDRASGGILWERQLRGAPGAGPGVSATHAFVPMINGLIEGFDLSKGAKQTPWIYKSAGRVLVSPLATESNVSWTTDKGYFYVADPAAKGIRYRLETRDAIHSQPAHWTPNMYAGSMDGLVYAVNEASGKIEWKCSTGDAILASPVAIGDKVFVISEQGGLHCLDAKDGTQLWFAPKMRQFVSLSPSRVYACDELGRLAALDAASGARLGAMPLHGITLKLCNNYSDRVYLANDSGVIQCLRDIDARSPTLYVPPPAESEADKPKSKLPAAGPKKDSSSQPEAVEEPDAAAMPEENVEAPAADADDPFK
jgi:outer membrane protein assembly factor BamB